MCEHYVGLYTFNIMNIMQQLFTNYKCLIILNNNEP